MRRSRVRPSLTACLLTVGLAVCPLGADAALASPNADFDWSPKPVVAGAPLTLVSTSTPSSSGGDDDDGGATVPIIETSWELAGWGPCAGSALTGTCRTTAPAPGRWEVTLTVTDVFFDSDTETKTIDVEAAAGAPSQIGPAVETIVPPRLMSPFPVVTVAGKLTPRGTRVERLAVRAPRGSRVVVRCRGRRCPLGRVARRVQSRRLRVRAAERLVPAGVTLEVLVSRGDSIGKFTRLRFRSDRPPRRADGCLWPGTGRMTACP